MPNKAKTPSAPTPEVSIINPRTVGITSMKNDTSLINKNQLTMSSREIADLVESRHDKVKQSIERLAKRGVIDIPPLGEYLDSLGRKATEYKLVKRDSYIVVAQLCPEFTARLVDRWQELEKKVNQFQLKLPTAKELALMVIQSEEEKERLLIENKTLGSQLEEIKPTVEAFDRIATKAEGSMCVTDTAKYLQVQPRKFFQELNSIGWIYKRSGSRHWLGYQDKVKQGLLEHKITTVSRSDGSEKIVEQVLITPKGLTKLSKLLSQKLVA